eukprot:GCRY01000443.1.p1 GENE.GCRY01000443.1~~GCRY01000443.1.p1  ORF type:complete len:350 (+),score=79.34 GCRY01000443.1:182-1231(+)
MEDPNDTFARADSEYDVQVRDILDRSKLIEMIKNAREEREKLNSHNSHLQGKLHEHFTRRNKNGEEAVETDKGLVDQQQRYYALLAQIEDFRLALADLQRNSDKQAMDLKLKLDEKDEKARNLRESFAGFKMEVALDAQNSRTGKKIPKNDIEVFQQKEAIKDGEVDKVRLKNIQLRSHHKKLENTVSQKEELADGLHLIDFEQLKIENQTHNEKIEERNEELLKLRKKTTATVQILTHVKEKLQFLQAENLEYKRELAVLEDELAEMRDTLSYTKQTRDSLRNANAKLQQQSGLVGNNTLLSDFEEKDALLQAKRKELDALQKLHARLTAQIQAARKGQNSQSLLINP